ncbi:MAG TPA: LCP family protein [Nocardioidaceae bacterium]|nr:LCP family protein [Nocardioidaceae bacterium]
MTAEEGLTRSRPGFVRRHKVVAILSVLVLLLAGAVVAFGFYLNSQLGNFSYFDSTLDPAQRAPEPTGAAAEARNILMLGTDKGSGESIEQELADGEWTTGAFRSDTIMLVHIPADQSQAFLVSIPRDSYVPIPGHDRQKINAAFSFGGPDLSVRTVENLTGVYIDHVAMIDWEGFKDLTHAIGGVQVTVAETFTDPKTGTWEAGTYNLEGQRALDYVRTRYALEEGDFDRIKRQQNFLRAVMQKTVSRGTLANPLKLTNLLQAVTDATTVDSGWTAGEMRRLALNLRDLGPSDVQYLTAPTTGTEDVEGVGNVVLLAPKESKALWEALRTDDVQGYLERYGGETLPASGQVR